MTEDKILIYLLFGTLFSAFTPIKAEKIDCPSKCHCSTDFIAVKCRGLDKFPVFEFAADVRSLDLSWCHIADIEKKDLKAYENLQYLDIRNNEIKSVSPGLFSEMETLRELHVDNNPWSCDQSTLHVLQMELTALVGEHSHLDNFDGGRIECYDPPHMKGKKPLHLSYPTVKVSVVQKVMKGRHADQHQSPDGVIALSIFLVVLVSAAICGAVWVFKENLLHWIRNAKPASDPASKMEAGEFDNKRILIDSMKKRRRMSQGLVASDSSSTSALDNEEVANLANEMQTDGQLDNKSILIDSMKKRRRMSQGMPASQTSSECNSDDEGLVDPANKMETDGQLENKNILIDSMKKRRRMSQGMPASQTSSACNSDDEGLVDATDYLKDRMQKQRRQSCGFAEGDNSSEDDSGLMPQ